jgi:aminopeptidase N
MRSVGDFPGVKNEAKPSPFGFAPARVLLVGMVATLMAAAGPARAVQIDQTEIDLAIDPNSESMTAQVRLAVSENVGNQQLVCYFLKPTRMDYCRDATSGRNVPYKFELAAPLQYGVYQFTMNLSRLGRECTLELGYAYSGKDFYGYQLNPMTLDNFTCGQITSKAVHASHLLYYPYTDGLTGTARIAITAPQGWTGVSAGVLQEQESLGSQTRFVYDIPYPSGLLPYPLAAAPYVVHEAAYQDRVRVSVYSSAADANYAQERLDVLTTRLLPFLEDLMGNYPLPNLRVVETFLKEGNIALGARGLVMLSQKMWFAASIGESYDALPVVVLADECAHQWNVYHVKFPNWLGEGLSEYTDNLYYERFVDSHWMATVIPAYRQLYTTTVDLLNRLKPLKDGGQTVEQAAQALGMSVEAVAPYWPYASLGELAISDPRVFPTLYFLKGALALQALRTQLGDEQFFAGFKKLFAVGTSEPVTLDYCRQAFESVHGASLADFFQHWYNDPGLPDN